MEQLKVCADADAADFHCKRLQDECPGFMWRSILTRRFLTERVTIPLSVPACQVLWKYQLCVKIASLCIMCVFVYV